MATNNKQIEESYGCLPKSFRDRPFYGFQLDEEQLHFADTILNPDIDIVFVNARAGTGKTTIAAGVANVLVKYGVCSLTTNHRGWISQCADEVRE